MSLVNSFERNAANVGMPAVTAKVAAKTMN